MGVPDWVETDHHHKPRDIFVLSERCKNTTILLTHTFIDDGYKILTTDVPQFPENIIHGSDGMKFEFDANGEIVNFS